MLRFEDENHLLSLAEDGRLLRWSVGEPGAKPALVMDLALPTDARIFRAELSRDGQWLAAVGGFPLIVLRPIGGGAARDIPLKGYKNPQVSSHDGEFGRALAFDPDGRRLAVAVGSYVPGAAFGLDADDRLIFCDLRQNPPKASDGPPHTYRADRLAFDPDGDFLAVAGGDNHEVTLWKLANLNKPVSVLRGRGVKSLWDVALSEDGRASACATSATRPRPISNARAQEPVARVPTCPRPALVPAADFKPTPRLPIVRRLDRGTRPQGSPTSGSAVPRTSGVHRFPLPLDRDRDGMPRCYTFLPKSSPPRLAVGHYWGFSIFELTRAGASRTRLCIGHAGEVTALAPSVDQTWLAACSDDMTVSAWSLTENWPSQSILGAKFSRRTTTTWW